MRINKITSRRQEVVFERTSGELITKRPSAIPTNLEYKPNEAIGFPYSARVWAKGRYHKTVKDLNAWINKQNITPTNFDALFLAFLKSWVKNPTLAPKVKNEQLSYRIGQLKLYWWESLTEEKKAYLRQVVGTSVELEDGTGWVKDEKSIALSAFDQACQYLVQQSEWFDSANSIHAQIDEAIRAIGETLGKWITVLRREKEKAIKEERPDDEFINPFLLDLKPPRF